MQSVAPPYFEKTPGEGAEGPLALASLRTSLSKPPLEKPRGRVLPTSTLLSGTLPEEELIAGLPVPGSAQLRGSPAPIDPPRARMAAQQQDSHSMAVQATTLARALQAQEEGDFLAASPRAPAPPGLAPRALAPGGEGSCLGVLCSRGGGMTEFLPAEVQEFQRRLSGPAQDAATWGSGSAALIAKGLESMLSLSADSGSESETEAPQGLSPVSSTSSLTIEACTPPRSAPHSQRGSLHAVALYCRFVGGGMQGSVDLCASVALVDEGGHVLLDTVVKPSIPVTNYRTASTGLTAADVNQGMPFRKARKLLLGFLRPPHGTPLRLDYPVGKSVVLVGVHLQHSLACLLLDLHLPPDCLRELESPQALATLKSNKGPVEIATEWAKLYALEQ